MEWDNDPLIFDDATVPQKKGTEMILRQIHFPKIASDSSGSIFQQDEATSQNKILFRQYFDEKTIIRWIWRGA